MFISGGAVMLRTEDASQPWLFTFKRHPVLFSFVIALSLDVVIKPLGLVVFGSLQAIPLWYLLPLRLVSLALWLLFFGSLLYTLAIFSWRALRLVVGGKFISKLSEAVATGAAVIGGFLWFGFSLWQEIGLNANSVGESANGWALIGNGAHYVLNFVWG